MANLIIKSSADNLVLQGSDASPAITVAAAGTTTFAEAATMSGNVTMSGTGNSIASLGTVASGNISNTAIVYPAGHVIKTTEVFPSDFGVSNYDGSTPTYNSPTTAVSMTSGNKMLITWQGTIQRSAGTTTHHTYMGVTGTGLPGTINQVGSNGRPAYLSTVTHYRWPTADTYSNGTAIILTDVINATSGTWGTWMNSGVGGSGTTFTLANQIVIFQEIQQ